jgi:hypothetical protein
MEKIKIHILYSITYVVENRAVYEIVLKNMVEPKGQHMTSQYCAYVLHAG